MSKKNKKFSCYAVVGSNGYALTNNWLDCQTYMKNLRRERHKAFIVMKMRMTGLLTSLMVTVGINSVLNSVVWRI